MDRYKRSISKKNKIYRPYTVDGIGNFLFFAEHVLLLQRVVRDLVRCRRQLQRQLRCQQFLRARRSPSRRSTDNTFFIYDDGEVSSDIWIVVDSYGINTPYMTDDDAFLVEPYGIIHNDYDISQTHNSYGFFMKYKIFDLNIPLFFALRAPNVIILHSK